MYNGDMHVSALKKELMDTTVQLHSAYGVLSQQPFMMSIFNTISALQKENERLKGRVIILSSRVDALSGEKCDVVVDDPSEFSNVDLTLITASSALADGKTDLDPGICSVFGVSVDRTL
jgi:hypothetical protein